MNNEMNNNVKAETKEAKASKVKGFINKVKISGKNKIQEAKAHPVKTGLKVAIRVAEVVIIYESVKTIRKSMNTIEQTMHTSPEAQIPEDFVAEEHPEIEMAWDPSDDVQAEAEARRIIELENMDNLVNVSNITE